MKQIKSDNLFENILLFAWTAYFFLIYSFGNLRFSMLMLLSVLMIGLCSIEIVYRMIKSRKFEISIHSLIFWYGVFFLWVGLAYLWTSHKGRSGNNYLIELGRPLLAFIGRDFYAYNRDRAIKLFKAFVTGTTCFAVLIFALSPVSSYGTLMFGKRLNQQRNTTGYVLYFSAIVGVYLFYMYKKVHWLAFSSICAVVSLLSGSRKIVFAYGVALALFIVGQKQIRKGVRNFLILLAIVLITIPILYQIPFVVETFGERLLAVVDDSIEDSSVMFRSVAKKAAVDVFLDSPIIGQGWNAVKNSFQYKGVSIYAHNNYLEVLADFGIVGAVLLFWRNVVWGIRAILRTRKGGENLVLAILIISIIMLDWGQVTYCYIYMLCPWGIVYKFYCSNMYWNKNLKIAEGGAGHECQSRT